MIHAWAEVSRRGPYDFALKVDTDALVINPFASRLVTFFEQHPRVGMVGSFLRFPDGSTRPGIENWAWRMRRACRLGFGPGGLSREPASFPASFARIMRRRRLLARARRHGYKEGEHVLGGSYAISRGVLERWRNSALDQLTHLFEGTKIGEDVTVSLLVRSVQYELADHNLPGEIFGVWHRALRVPPEVLVRQYAVVHSVKTGSEQNEADLRRAFKRYREGV
jgi:hypothetical protein